MTAKAPDLGGERGPSSAVSRIPRPAPSAPRSVSHGPGGHGHTQASLKTLALAALGVVYGDIGTSPLYALQQCVYGDTALHPAHFPASTVSPEEAVVEHAKA